MTDDFALPPPDRLFTWVDIDEHLRALAVHRRWPAWLREVSAYWDGVEITVVTGTGEDEIWSWLRSVLGPRLVDAERAVVLLEHPHEERALPIVFAMVNEADLEPVNRLPEWSETLLTSDLARPLPAPSTHRFADGVTIGAFHSFKGGVGRTLHCVALAHLVASRSNERVLLIDADMEAPGVSWMMRPDGAWGEFSFADFMALVHGSVDGGSAEAVAVARPHLIDQEMDGIFILPAQRNPDRFGPPRIEPRHLLSPGRSPYLLTESLGELAGALGARTVLIDLRAGMSETSAPVLLDPRVKRVFVTTVSDQSVRGTVRILEELALRAPSMRETDPVPTALITQFRDDGHEDLVESISERLGEAIAGITSFGDENDNSTIAASGELSRTLTSAPMRSPFNASLLALPAGWSQVRAALDRADTHGVLQDLADELTPDYRPSDDERLSRNEVEIVQRNRRRLADFVGQAGLGEIRDTDAAPFPPPGLVDLAAEHRTELPVEVVTGTAGSGKTSAFLGLCRSDGWRGAARNLGVDGVERDAPILPVLASIDSALSSPDAALADAPSDPFDPARVEANMRTLTEALSEDLTDAEWLRIWFTCFARAAGLTSFPDMADEVLSGLAAKGRAVFAIDGLDELFQDAARDERQQRALRVLLVDCREWFRALHGRPLGLVVFLRRDLVQQALGADAEGFLNLRRRYAMVWDRGISLRFTAWAVNAAKALQAPKGRSIRRASENDLSEYLVGLWGDQLGSVGTKEARSQEWFLAALADFTNQIQPGDVLRFLSEAARLSVAEPGDWTRVLTPSAMRAALPVCSRARVDAISRTIPAIGGVLARLAGLDESRRSVPFEPEAVALTPDEVELLTANGIIAQVKGEYWMPEIYRSALGFTARRRPPLLSIAKEARRRFPDL